MSASAWPPACVIAIEVTALVRANDKAASARAAGIEDRSSSISTGRGSVRAFPSGWTRKPSFISPPPRLGGERPAARPLPAPDVRAAEKFCLYEHDRRVRRLAGRPGRREHARHAAHRACPSAGQRRRNDPSVVSRTTGSACRAPSAGIYGPDRLPLDRLRKSEPVVRPEDAGITNRIHVDDLVTACEAAVENKEARGVYNVTDGNSISSTRFMDLVAGSQRPAASAAGFDGGSAADVQPRAPVVPQ